MTGWQPMSFGTMCRLACSSILVLSLGCVTEGGPRHGFLDDVRAQGGDTVRFSEPQHAQTLNLDDFAVDEDPFRWNEIRHDDGRRTRFYYFRAGYLSMYMPLLREAVPELDPERPDINIVESPNFVVDSRPKGNPANFSVDPTWGIPSATMVLDPSQDKPDSRLADMLTLTAPLNVLAQVDAFLRSLLLAVPQIEVSVRVVEITSADELEWGVTVDVLTGTVEEAAKTLFKQGSLTLPANLKEGVLLHLSGVHDDATIDMFLEFIQKSTNADIMSEPKMVVLNGHRAVVETGGETPILNPNVNSEGEVSSASVKFQPTGVLLVVTPFLLHDDLIQLALTTRVSAVTSQVSVAEFADGPLINPIISKRDAYTVVNVRNKQTLVIGGLQTSEVIEAETKVPILGDIPLLGYLFKKDSQVRRTSRTIYLISASIVTPNDTLRRSGVAQE